MRLFVPGAVLRKGGPYIGPRGGKWADPKHTIPWKEDDAPSGPSSTKSLWDTDWKRSSAHDRLEVLAGAGLDPRAAREAARRVFGDWADDQDVPADARDAGPGAPEFRAALREADGADAGSSQDFEESLDALGDVVDGGEGTFTALDEALGHPQTWGELRDRFGAWALAHDGLVPDKAKLGAALARFVREAEGEYAFEARDAGAVADDAERVDAEMMVRWEGFLTEAGIKLPKAKATKEIARARKAHERARAKLERQLAVARAEEAAYERATEEAEDDADWPEPPDTSAEGIEDEIYDLDESWESEYGPLERAVQAANRARGYEVDPVPAKPAAAPHVSKKAEKSLRHVVPRDVLEKAKYTRRWRGPDGKWQYEYHEDRKPRVKLAATLAPDDHKGAFLQAEGTVAQAKALVAWIMSDPTGHMAAVGNKGRPRGGVEGMQRTMREFLMQAAGDPSHEDHADAVSFLASQREKVADAAARQKAERAEAKAERERAKYEAQGVEIEPSSPPKLSQLRGKKVWLYHGTTTALVDPAKGLTPSRAHGKQSNVGASAAKAASPDFVFLTAKPSGTASAEFYARGAVAKHGGEPLIMRVLVDGDDLDHDPDDVDISSGSYQYTIDSVPAEQIMEVNGERLRKSEGPRLLIKAQRPPGSGWAPIPGGKKGGFRKRDGKGGWEYWYPDGKAPRRRATKLVPEGQLGFDFAAEVEALDVGDERYGLARPPITASGAKLTKLADALKRIETAGRAFAAAKPGREDMRRYVEGVLRVAQRLEEVHEDARSTAPGVLPKLRAFDVPLAGVKDALRTLADPRFFENDGARAAHLGEVSRSLATMADVCQQEHAILEEVQLKSDTFAEAGGFALILSGQDQGLREAHTERDEITTAEACERVREKLDRAGLRDVGRGQKVLVLHQPKANHLTGRENGVAGWYQSHGEDRGMIAMLETASRSSPASAAYVLTHEIGHGVYYERLGEKQIARWEAFFDETHPANPRARVILSEAIDRYVEARMGGASPVDAADTVGFSFPDLVGGAQVAALSALVKQPKRGPSLLERLAVKSSPKFAEYQAKAALKRAGVDGEVHVTSGDHTATGFPRIDVFVGTRDEKTVRKVSNALAYMGFTEFDNKRPTGLLADPGDRITPRGAPENRTAAKHGVHFFFTSGLNGTSHYPEEIRQLLLLDEEAREGRRKRRAERGRAPTEAVVDARISDYADHNASEYWAETFAHYVAYGPKAVPPRVRASFEAVMADAGFRLRKALVIPSDVLRKGAERPPGGGWGPIPGGKHGGMRRKRAGRWEYWYPGGKGGPSKRKARPPTLSTEQMGLDFGAVPKLAASPTPQAPGEPAERPSKEAAAEYGVEAPQKPAGVPDSPAPKLDVPSAAAGVGPPPEILWIRDTREREPAESENGKEFLRPIPGTGELRSCDRCGRMHEVHVGVRYADGRSRVVGTGCMGTSKEYGRSIANLAVRIATKKAEIDQAASHMAEWKEALAKVYAMPVPPAVDGPPQFSLAGRPGWEGEEGSVTVGDARVTWRQHVTTADPGGAAGMRAAVARERQTAVESATLAWRENRLNEIVGGKARRIMLENAEKALEILPKEVTALERTLDYKTKGEEYLSAFGAEIRAQAQQAAAQAGGPPGSPEWFEAEGAKLADFAANLNDRVKAAKRAERKGDDGPLGALKAEWTAAREKAREIEEEQGKAMRALRQRWIAADPLGMDPGPDPGPGPDGNPYTVERYAWEDRKKALARAALDQFHYQLTDGHTLSSGEGYLRTMRPTTLIPWDQKVLPLKKQAMPNDSGVAAMLRQMQDFAKYLRAAESKLASVEKSHRVSPRLVLRKSAKPPGAGWQVIPGGTKGGFRRRKGPGWEHWYPEDTKQPSLQLGAVRRGASNESKAKGVLGADFDKLRQRGFSAVPIEEALKGVKRMSDLASDGLPLDKVRALARAGVAMVRREDKGGQITMFGSPEPRQNDLLFSHGRVIATTSYEELIKGMQRGGKYIKRVPYTDAKGRRRYRYFYRESAIARDVKAGEEIKLGTEHAKVENVAQDGAITISTPQGKKTIAPGEWGRFVASYYGERYYGWAETRAKQSINAVLRMVPRPMLEDLPGETDAQRLEALATRVPKVYAKLQAAFKRAGVSPYRAKEILAATLERRGWKPDARAAVVGSVLFHRTGPTSVRLIIDGAENLAGGKKVEAKHVAGLVELVGRTHGDTGGIGEKVAEAGHQAEEELAMISKLLAKAQSGKLEDQRDAIAAFARVAGIPKIDMLAQAFPGLRDRAIEDARKAIREAPAVAPGPPKTHGGETTLYLAGPGGKAKAMRARYRLMPASEVVASHDPARGFKPREDYPAGVQERAYHRDQAEQAKVIRNAQRLEPAFVANTNPDAVNGPPMVTPDGIALGGNSRTMSMQSAYAQHPEKAAELREYLKKNAIQFGFSEADVDAIENPILVREVAVDDTSPENMKLLVRQMNESFTQAMDPRTMQVAMGRKLDESTIAALSNAIEPDETLASFLASPRSDAFVNALHRAGVIDDRNVSQYMTKGTRRLNEDGRNMVASILVGKLIGDADLLANTRTSMVSNLARSTPAMLAAADGGKGYDLGDDLAVALSAFNDLTHRAEAGTIPTLDPKMDKSTYQKLYNAFDSLFGDKHPVTENPRARLLLETLIRRPGPQQLSAVFREYADRAKQNPEDQVTMFGKVEPIDVLRDALKSAVGAVYE